MGENRLSGEFNPKSYFWVIIALMIILYARFVALNEENPNWKIPQVSISQLLR